VLRGRDIKNWRGEILMHGLAISPPRFSKFCVRALSCQNFLKKNGGSSWAGATIINVTFSQSISGVTFNALFEIDTPIGQKMQPWVTTAPCSAKINARIACEPTTTVCLS